MPVPAGDEALGVRLEQLHDIDLAALQRLRVLRHRGVGGAGERGGVDAGAVEVVIEQHPGRGHVGRDAEARADQVLQAEARIGLAPDQHERVAGHDLRETDERARPAPRMGGVVVHHHPHRPAEGDIRAPLDQPPGGLRRRGREPELDFQPLGLEQPGPLRQVERRVAARAQILVKDDLFACHGGRVARRAGRAIPDACAPRFDNTQRSGPNCRSDARNRHSPLPCPRRATRARHRHSGGSQNENQIDNRRRRNAVRRARPVGRACKRRAAVEHGHAVGRRSTARIHRQGHRQGDRVPYQWRDQGRGVPGWHARQGAQGDRHRAQGRRGDQP